jgi:hypothetical protein
MVAAVIGSVLTLTLPLIAMGGIETVLCTST